MYTPISISPLQQEIYDAKNKMTPATPPLFCKHPTMRYINLRFTYLLTGQTHTADELLWPFVIMEALGGFLMTQRQVTLKDRRMLVYNARKLHQPRMSDAFLADSVDTTVCK